MIRLTRINHARLVLNSDLIEHIESTPDTVVTLTTGQVLMVLESADEVIERVLEFKRSVYAEALRCPFDLRATGGAAGSARPMGEDIGPNGG
jgi:flagellar protein FlbD